MKEIRLNKYDLFDLPSDSNLAKIYIRSTLEKAGFDLDRKIEFHYDVMKDENVYIQKD